MFSKSLTQSWIPWLFFLLLNSETKAAEIVGQITDSESNIGIPHAIVRAIPQEKNRHEVKTETDEDGKYSLELLRGKYLLFISVPNSNYLPRFYSATNQEQGDFISVPTFQSFIIKNVSLDSGGSVSGSVRWVMDNSPINNVRIYAEAPNFRVSVHSNGDGSYIFRGLPPNIYKIHIMALDENFISVYFDGALDSGHAVAIHLERQQEVSGIDFRLRPGGVITGRVYAAKSREPVFGLKVIAEKQNSQEPPLFAYSDSQGFFILRGLTDGPYIVETGSLIDSHLGTAKNYLTQYYHDRFDKELAAKITIQSGNTVTGIDFSMVEGGKISGKGQSRHNNSPVSRMEILPQDITKAILSPPKGKTDDSGHYLIENLAPGEYILDTALPKESQRLVKVFYRDKLSSEHADKVTVEEGLWIRDIDFNLALGATLKGRLKTDHPDYRFSPAVDNVALKRVAPDWEGYGERNFKIKSDGSFIIEGTPPGRYFLNPKIVDPNVLPLQSPELKVLDVAEGETVEGIDLALKIGGSISGTISTQSSFYGLDKLLLILISVQENAKTYFDLKEEHYTIAGIQPGKYVLVLLSNPQKTHPSEAFQPTRVFDTRSVEVFKGKTTRNVDFQIARATENQSGLVP